MGEKDFRISADELHRLEVECPGCKSAIVFQARSERGPGDQTCPNCSGAMPGIAQLVHAYRKFFEMVTEHKAGVHFLIRLDD